MYMHVYTFLEMYAVYMSILFCSCTYVSELVTVYTIGMYYCIVHTYHIHGSDMYVHVYARWVGLMIPDGARAPGRACHLGNFSELDSEARRAA